ncbi:LEA type 2 family protein [Geobacter sp. DSM 9736]|uniref:LEA type 2 family protein n=1 Tax=Geobacter sp. DSM 9736 TaxID=1277350 RepID=UPI000B506C5A|nr:LEA type 2 family protein [Geobacter sp. DSM 9736]SNB44651.1 LEA14-like dessication related protein [Geobacter sp. DSM 9736]
MKKLPVILLFLFLLTACSSLVSDPDVRVSRVNVVGFDSSGLDLEFYLNVSNPNSFGVTLQGYSYDVQVMALPVARGGARERVEFKAESMTDMRLPVRVQYRDLLEVIKRRPDPDRIPYRLNAGLDLDTPVGRMNVPIDRTATFAVPEEYRPSWMLKQVSDIFDRIRP